MYVCTFVTWCMYVYMTQWDFYHIWNKIKIIASHVLVSYVCTLIFTHDHCHFIQITNTECMDSVPTHSITHQWSVLSVVTMRCPCGTWRLQHDVTCSGQAPYHHSPRWQMMSVDFVQAVLLFFSLVSLASTETYSTLLVCGYNWWQYGCVDWRDWQENSILGYK